MANLIDNKVSTFTPVASIDHPWIQTPAWYLKPFGGRGAVQVPVDIREDGSKGAVRTHYRAPWYESAAKIASYILSLGILPLLAAIATVAIRCYYKFHWVQQAGPVININQLQDQFGQFRGFGDVARDPQMQALSRNPQIQRLAFEMMRNPEALQGMVGQLGQLQQLNAQYQQFMEHPQLHGLEDLPDNQPPLLEPLREERPLVQRPGENRLGAPGQRQVSSEERRRLTAEAAEKRLNERRMAEAAGEPK